jgi:hypothetical protein
VLHQEDLLGLVASALLQELSATWNMRHPEPARSTLRALSSTTRELLDLGTTKLYCDAAQATTQLYSRLPRLNELRLEGADDAAIAALLDTAAAAVLVHLSLPWARAQGDHALLSSATARGLRLKALLELNLSGCGELTDGGLEQLVGLTPLLQTLRVTMNHRLRSPRLPARALRSVALCICANLEDEAVSRICARSAALQELSVWRCSSLSLPALCFGTSALESLNLCECSELRADVVSALCAPRTGCTALRSLLLAGCHGVDFSGGARRTASHPARGAGHAPLRDAGALRHLGGPRLTVLDLSDSGLTDDALALACVSSPRLQRLDVSRWRG